MVGSVVIGRGMPCAGNTARGAGGSTERVGRDTPRAAAPGPRARDRACRHACRADGLHAQGGSRRLARKGRAAGALLRPLYAGTALVAFLLQALLGRAILARIGLGGSVASHPVLVGAAGLLGFVAPAPWRAILPRGLDVDAARVNLPGRLRALLHAAGRGSQAGCQVDGGRER